MFWTSNRGCISDLSYAFINTFILMELWLDSLSPLTTGASPSKQLCILNLLEYHQYIFYDIPSKRQDLSTWTSYQSYKICFTRCSISNVLDNICFVSWVSICHCRQNISVENKELWTYSLNDLETYILTGSNLKIKGCYDLIKL